MSNLNLFERALVESYSIDLRQFIDFRQSVLPNGLRQIEAYNGSGLTFTLLPDRGLDVWTAHYNGLPLTWISQNAPHPPDYGANWIRLFNGGLVVTCGMTYIGHGEVDDVTGKFNEIHGHYTRLHAEDIRVTRGWQGERYIVELTGVIVEAEIFGAQLRLTRTYRMTLGDPTIELFDTVYNAGDEESVCMLMYHCNLGYPLVGEGARLLTAHARVVPTTDDARGGIHRWAEYDAPTPGYPEQVFFHQLKADASGQTEVALVRGDLGLSWAWDTRQMPYLTQWKNTRTKLYVCGVEPSTSLPEGLNRPRKAGRLAMLQSGASLDTVLRLSVLDGADAVKAAAQRIDRLQQTGTAVAAPALLDYPD